jgi:hypothetical protein
MVETKNLGVLALLGVLIIVIAFVSGCTQNNKEVIQNSDTGVTTNLQAYPGSQESREYNMWATITGFSSQFSEFHSYTIDGISPTEIINWYKSKYADYSVVDEGTTNNNGTTIATLTLKKGDTMIGIMAFEQEGKTVYFIGKATAPEEEGASLPNHDMASGEEPLQRYPNSVMIEYTKEGKFPIDYEITYGTNDEFNKVINWFKETMQSNGWEITYQSGSSDTEEMVFEKGDDEVTVWIGAPNEDTTYTEITISYTRRSLPTHDIASGEVPIPRYPNSVMIDYHKSSMTFEGYSSIEIKAVYLTPDSFDKVKQWYLEKLGDMFPGIEDSGESVDAGSTTTTVHIDFEKHNSYTEVSIDYVKG